MRNLHAKLVTEDGRPTRRMVPPRTTIFIPVEREEIGQVYSHPILVRRCLFAVNLPYEEETWDGIWLYNGSLEVQWISNGDIIARAT